MQVHFFILIIFLLIFVSPNKAQIQGCTDTLATNFMPQATENNGSCVYANASVSVSRTYILDSSVLETSGLILVDNQLLTHNDNSDIQLYGLDTANGQIVQTLPLNQVSNQDWEEISQDSDYIYIGDFGNNVSGNRTNLHILKIAKNSLFNANPLVDTIFFNYNNQTNFNNAGANNTDFDCEAFIVSDDSIYLFTKQWISGNTAIYKLPKQAGTHTAELKTMLNIQGLITGATFIKNKKIIALCGYTGALQPFIFLIYELNNFNFELANKRKIFINLPFHQIEAIASEGANQFYLTNEKLTRGGINTAQKLHILDLSVYLNPYLNSLLSIPKDILIKKYTLFPNPAADILTLQVIDYYQPQTIFIYNYAAQLVEIAAVDKEYNSVNISHLQAGIYILKIENEYLYFYKK